MSTTGNLAIIEESLSIVHDVKILFRHEHGRILSVYSFMMPGLRYFCHGISHF